MAVKLSTAQVEVLRLCDNPLGFFAGDMSAGERRSVLALVGRGLLTASDGKKAHITPAGRVALRSAR